MKIFDCFMYFDEDLILDLRLNILNDFVDCFVIVESSYNHNGERKKLNFDINKFGKFKNKIKYLIYDQIPKNIKEIKKHYDEDEKTRRYIHNAYQRENGQRNFISNGLKDANLNDIILISDVDEIPNLENVDFNQIKEKIIFFQQDMFYYKLNLKFPNFIWVGTKACRKKSLKSPQWLRNIKDKKYSFYRIDTLFSETKYINLKFIENGGWHFTNIKTADEIKHKLESYLHHREFDTNPLSINEINQIIFNKKTIYDLTADQKKNKIGIGKSLEIYNVDKLPEIIKKNLEKYEDWIEK